MRLVWYEWKKLLRSRMFLAAVCLLLAVNALCAFKRIDPSLAPAYVRLHEDLTALSSDEERLCFLIESLKRNELFQFIALVERGRAEEDELTAWPAAAVNEALALYAAGNATVYTDRLYTEEQLLSSVKADLEAVLGYRAYSSGIPKRAELMLRLGIVGEGDGFRYRSVR